MHTFLNPEKEYILRGIACAGVDEAGRGALAGPVVAAAVCLRATDLPPSLRDSKKMTPAARDEAYRQLTGSNHHIAVSVQGVDVIEKVNILKATFLAMNAALDDLRKVVPIGHAFIDGNRFPARGDISHTTVIGGDDTVASIAAASVIAKVTRDRIMEQLDEVYPGYGLAHHKGYGTKQHRHAIATLGPTPAHRLSFLGNILPGLTLFD